MLGLYSHHLFNSIPFIFYEVLISPDSGYFLTKKTYSLFTFTVGYSIIHDIMQIKVRMYMTVGIAIDA